MGTRVDKNHRGAVVMGKALLLMTFRKTLVCVYVCTISSQRIAVVIALVFVQTGWLSSKRIEKN